MRLRSVERVRDNPSRSDGPQFTPEVTELLLAFLRILERRGCRIEVMVEDANAEHN